MYVPAPFSWVVGVSAGGAFLILYLCGMLLYMVKKERAGEPIFTPLVEADKGRVEMVGPSTATPYGMTPIAGGDAVA